MEIELQFKVKLVFPNSKLTKGCRKSGYFKTLMVKGFGSCFKTIRHKKAANIDIATPLQKSAYFYLVAGLLKWHSQVDVRRLFKLHKSLIFWDWFMLCRNLYYFPNILKFVGAWNPNRKQLARNIKVWGAGRIQVPLLPVRVLGHKSSQTWHRWYQSPNLLSAFWGKEEATSQRSSQTSLLFVFPTRNCSFERW